MKYSQTDKDKWVEWYLEDDYRSIEETALEFGVSVHNVRNEISARGVAKPKWRVGQPQHNRANANPKVPRPTGVHGNVIGFGNGAKRSGKRRRGGLK